MPILDNSYKWKSAVITAIILTLLLFGIFNYGLKYLDPPVEYGLRVKFGISEEEGGKSIEKPQEVSTPKIQEKQEVVKEQKVIDEVKKAPKEIKKKEKMITKETSKDVPVVEKIKKEKKIEKIEKVKKKPIKEKQKPSKQTEDALNSLLKKSTSKGKSEGKKDEQKVGVKGNKKGTSNSSKYYKNTGNGDNGNYNLSGRKALYKPIKKPGCQEEGVVVVRIQVDKKGKVINAIPGVKGSTNTAPCLLKPAKEAALQTRWNSDEKAPSKQVGTIIYRFILSK